MSPTWAHFGHTLEGYITVASPCFTTIRWPQLYSDRQPTGKDLALIEYAGNHDVLNETNAVLQFAAGTEIRQRVEVITIRSEQLLADPSVIFALPIL